LGFPVDYGVSLSIFGSSLLNDILFEAFLATLVAFFDYCIPSDHLIIPTSAHRGCCLSLLIRARTRTKLDHALFRPLIIDDFA
jgi:hypothetical protein